MDQHGEKEENNFQESASAAIRREETAAAEGEDTSDYEESMNQREDGYKADDWTGLVEDDVVGSEEASAPPLPFAHPWSLLRACAGCLGLLGCCGDTKPTAAAVAATEAATAAARSSQEEEAGGEKAKANPPPPGFYIQEVITRVRAVAMCGQSRCVGRGRRTTREKGAVAMEAHTIRSLGL